MADILHSGLKYISIIIVRCFVFFCFADAQCILRVESERIDRTNTHANSFVSFNMKINK